MSGDVPTQRVPMPVPATPPGRQRVDSVVVGEHGMRQGKVDRRLRRDGAGLGQGLAGRVVELMKSGDWKVGEQSGRPPRRGLVDPGGRLHVESTDLDESAAKNMHVWRVAKAKLASGDYELVILDEITYVVNYGWVPAAEVAEGILGRSARTNVVVTGRDAPPSWWRSQTPSPR